jgi:hypothetical protein
MQKHEDSCLNEVLAPAFDSAYFSREWNMEQVLHWSSSQVKHVEPPIGDGVREVFVDHVTA